MFEYTLPPDYRDIRALADGVAAAMAPRIAAGLPLYIMIDGDIAQTLGGILRDELAVGVDLLILDGLSLRDFDFIDLGKIRLPSLTVPVTVKSLLFSDDPRAPSRADRIASAAALAQATPAQRHGHHHHDHDHHHAQAPKSPSPAVDSPVREPANKTPFPMTEREGQG